MTIAPPMLRLQRDHTNRPYGGGWWPSGPGVSNELLDLIARWPGDRPSILRYAYISDDWDRAESAVPPGFRTRTLILSLSDRSTCRLLIVPTSTSPSVAAEFMEQVSDSTSSWRKMDFVSTYRNPARRAPATPERTG
jgi:hypothetical protein